MRLPILQFAPEVLEAARTISLNLSFPSLRLPHSPALPLSLFALSPPHKPSRCPLPALKSMKTNAISMCLRRSPASAAAGGSGSQRGQLGTGGRFRDARGERPGEHFRGRGDHRCERSEAKLGKNGQAVPVERKLELVACWRSVGWSYPRR